MKQYRVLFNPLSGDGTGKAAAMHLMELLPDNELRFFDLTQIGGMESFLAKTDPKDTLLIAGGDGTVCRFADAARGLTRHRPIYYYATGQNNDFWRDLGRQPGDPPIPIDRYLRTLPVVQCGGQTRHFVSHVTLGEVSSSLFSLKVTVNGEAHSFSAVRFAAVTSGKYCAGGLLSPRQDRLCPENGLTVTILHDTPRFGLAGILRALRTGNAERYPGSVTVLRSCTLQLQAEWGHSAPPVLLCDGERMSPDGAEPMALTCSFGTEDPVGR